MGKNVKNPQNPVFEYSAAAAVKETKVMCLTARQQPLVPRQLSLVSRPGRTPQQGVLVPRSRSMGALSPSTGDFSIPFIIFSIPFNWLATLLLANCDIVDVNVKITVVLECLMLMVKDHWRLFVF